MEALYRQMEGHKAAPRCRDQARDDRIRIPQTTPRQMTFDDLPLFNHVSTPAHNGTDTSREAADSIKPVLGALQNKVLDAFMAAGPMGLTTEECEQILGLKHQTCSPRIYELSKCQPPYLVLGQDEEHQIIKRPTTSGRKAKVYFHAEAV